MDLQTTLKLLDAGYTKEEIKAMSPVIDSPEKPAETPETPAQPTTPETTPAGTTPEPQRVDPETNKIISDLTKQVSDLAGVIKVMQDTNVKNAQQPATSKDTAQTVLESFFGKPN